MSDCCTRMEKGFCGAREGVDPVPACTNRQHQLLPLTWETYFKKSHDCSTGL